MKQGYTIAVTQYVKSCHMFYCGRRHHSLSSCCGVAIVSVAALGKCVEDIVNQQPNPNSVHTYTVLVFNNESFWMCDFKV